MNKYSLLLIALLSLLGTGHALAQTAPDADRAESGNTETVKPEVKADPKIKVVPAARDNKAKPAKVSSTKPSNARPAGSRPARNPRPSSRPVKPGNGRN